MVLEGNRRIAALKLFKKPSILTDTRMRQKYSKLHDEYNGKEVAKNGIECLIVNSREEANLWIERKHEGEMNGAGTVKWNSVQSARFRTNKTGKDSRVVQLIDFMKAAAEGDKEFEEQLLKVKATNLERLMSTASVCSELGLTYNQGEYASLYEWGEIMKGLKSVVSRLSQKGFKVSDIYRKGDRERFISSIPREELPDKTKKVETPWKLKDFNAEQRRTNTASQQEEDDNIQQNRSGGNQTQRPTTRDTFLPKDLSLNIPNERINRIFSELRLLSHNTMPNICAVMMRVLLELSVDCYLEEFHLLRKGVVSASKDPRDLKQKTNDVINQMNQKKIYLDPAKAKGIRTEINNDKSVFGIDTMNAYVHNLSFNPIPETLMLLWDNIEPFIVALWNAINDNRK